MSFWGQLNLMDPASPIQEEMILFHDHALTLLIGIFAFVCIMGVSLLITSLSTRTIVEAQLLETVWTVIPALLLLWLAFPSMRLLYLLDDNSNSEMSLKSIGHQWYWSYETNSVKIESYMISDHNYRLLEVDKPLLLQIHTNYTNLLTSADVLHSWALPSIGVKMDAVPGRLNSMNLYWNYPGIYYGQCSEICGANHSFMPIQVKIWDPNFEKQMYCECA
ncbi:cytochrome c oxidase subunit II (mitochondrion) [Physella acuta]|uniref:Cytochrome c oxidase subunit 2 n=1 Tax=Physella acuta TaxID=109671 RepID=V9IPJ3_PHYAT|nr:cytochrome c oxidase subunit II [Physella acuta]AFE62765.1 cytochrome c oxidase subunit II [Physella acuta]